MLLLLCVQATQLSLNSLTEGANAFGVTVNVPCLSLSLSGCVCKALRQAAGGLQQSQSRHQGSHLQYQVPQAILYSVQGCL